MKLEKIVGTKECQVWALTSDDGTAIYGVVGTVEALYRAAFWRPKTEVDWNRLMYAGETVWGYLPHGGKPVFRPTKELVLKDAEARIARIGQGGENRPPKEGTL